MAMTTAVITLTRRKRSVTRSTATRRAGSAATTTSASRAGDSATNRTTAATAPTRTTTISVRIVRLLPLHTVLHKLHLFISCRA